MSGSKETVERFNGETEEEIDTEENETFQSLKSFQADLCKDLSDLSRQVRMISDSLAAYNQFSRRRHVNSRHGANSSRARMDSNPLEIIEDSSKYGILPPGRRRIENVLSKKDEKGTALWYMTQDRSFLGNLDGRRTYYKPKNTPPGDSNTNSERSHGWNRENLKLNLKEGIQAPSSVGIYHPEEVDSRKILTVIERELRTLMDLAPPVTLIVIELVDIIRHYKECFRCNQKFQEFLPEILNRVQNLIKYIRNKRGKRYVWPNDFTYLRPSSTKLSVEVSQEKEEQPPSILLGKLEKVNAIFESDDKPGIQIQLLVKPERAKKRFYDRTVRSIIQEDFFTNLRFPTLLVNEFDNVSTFPGSANASKLVEKLVKEEEEKAKMEEEKVKDLEVEIKNLKDLMLEVHKNQIELSKVLLEKEIYSQPIIKLTDPCMLEEESRAVSRAAQMETPRRTSSEEELQMTVDELKKKCAFKNRMIVTLLKGLRSNVPKEWWEELVDCIFAESKSIQDFDSARLNEFIRQTSLYLVNGEEKGSTAKLSSPSIRDSPSKDFPTGPTCSKEDVDEFGNRDLSIQEEFEEIVNEKRRRLVEQSERLSALMEPACDSSFIQSIMEEDSRVGMAVVDLFVAIKKTKEKLNNLMTINNEIADKMNALKRETQIMRIDYRDLVGNVNDFFNKMSSAANTSVSNMSEAVPAAESDSEADRRTEPETREEDDKLKSDTKSERIFKGRIKREDSESLNRLTEEMEPGTESVQGSITSSDATQNRCDAKTGNAIVEARNSPVQIIRMTLDDVMAAAVVNSIKKKECDFGEKTSSDSVLVGTSRIRGSEGMVRLSETNVRMICEICQMLVENLESNKNPIGESFLGLEGIVERPSADRKEQTKHVEVEIHRSLAIAEGSQSDRRVQQEREKKGSLTKEEENVSDGDSLFEEALSEPIPDGNARPNVSCMGDLTEGSNRKSVSTLTNTCGIETSWIGKLAEDIKSTIRKLRPNFKKRVIIPAEDVEKLSKPFGGLEFTVSAKTPVGVFDVTVREFKQIRQKTDANHYWSNESLQNSNFEGPSPMMSVTGEEEFEEFIEVYVQSRKIDQNSQRASVSLKKGNMLKATLKQDKLPIFEVEKCHPQNFVQEILLKEGRMVAARKKSKEIGRTKNRGDEISRRKTSNAEVSTNDLIIYIQVEVGEEEEGREGEEDDGEEEEDSRLPFFECKSNMEAILVKMERVVGGLEFAQVTKVPVEDHREARAFVPVTADESNDESSDKIDFAESEMEIVDPKEPGQIKVKSVTFPAVSSHESMKEEKLSEVLPKEEERESVVWETSTLVRYLHTKWKPIACTIPDEFHRVSRMEIRRGRPKKEPVVERYVPRQAPELERALNLIREIENNVVGVKLSDALLILPNLESELRKHLQKKIKRMSERETYILGKSTEEFFSTVDFSKYEEVEGEVERKRKESMDSEERLCNLFKLLSNLEEAVKMNEVSSEKIDLCECDSSRIYHLLHALTGSIREVENGPNVTNLAETLNIASKLDTAVREYDSMSKKEFERNCVEPERSLGTVENSSWKTISVKEQMNNVRKKVFQTVEGEAIKTESRIERDFDRIDRLERENEEAIKFVEAFLEKTTRRASELDLVKKELKTLAFSLDEILVEIIRQREREERKNRLETRKEIETKREKGGGKEKSTEEEPVRNTVSGLLTALNNLKSRAKEKKEICREILERKIAPGSDKVSEEEKKISRSSRSSFTAKAADDLLSTIKDFRRIGETSLYLAWSKPEGASADHVIGYEVTVNGQVNQKVRNPERTQAILYSVDLSRKVDIQLFGLTENKPRQLLAALTHYDT